MRLILFTGSSPSLALSCSVNDAISIEIKQIEQSRIANSVELFITNNFYLETPPRYRDSDGDVVLLDLDNSYLAAVMDILESGMDTMSLYVHGRYKYENEDGPGTEATTFMQNEPSQPSPSVVPSPSEETAVPQGFSSLFDAILDKVRIEIREEVRRAVDERFQLLTSSATASASVGLEGLRTASASPSPTPLSASSARSAIRRLIATEVDLRKPEAVAITHTVEQRTGTGTVCGEVPAFPVSERLSEVFEDVSTELETSDIVGADDDDPLLDEEYQGEEEEDSVYDTVSTLSARGRSIVEEVEDSLVEEVEKQPNLLRRTSNSSASEVHDAEEQETEGVQENDDQDREGNQNSKSSVEEKDQEDVQEPITKEESEAPAVDPIFSQASSVYSESPVMVSSVRTAVGFLDQSVSTAISGSFAGTAIEDEDAWLDERVDNNSCTGGGVISSTADGEENQSGAAEITKSGGSSKFSNLESLHLMSLPSSGVAGSSQSKSTKKTQKEEEETAVGDLRSKDVSLHLSLVEEMSAHEKCANFLEHSTGGGKFAVKQQRSAIAASLSCSEASMLADKDEQGPAGLEAAAGAEAQLLAEARAEAAGPPATGLLECSFYSSVDDCVMNEAVKNVLEEKESVEAEAQAEDDWAKAPGVGEQFLDGGEDLGSLVNSEYELADKVMSLRDAVFLSNELKKSAEASGSGGAPPSRFVCLHADCQKAEIDVAHLSEHDPRHPVVRVPAGASVESLGLDLMSRSGISLSSVGATVGTSSSTIGTKTASVTTEELSLIDAEIEREEEVSLMSAVDSKRGIYWKQWRLRNSGQVKWKNVTLELVSHSPSLEPFFCSISLPNSLNVGSSLEAAVWMNAPVDTRASCTALWRLAIARQSADAPKRFFGPPLMFRLENNKKTSNGDGEDDLMSICSSTMLGSDFDLIDEHPTLDETDA